MPETKLFLNGARWWLRLPAPCAARTRVSTGTSDLKLATKIRDMIDDMATSPLQRHWVVRVGCGIPTLMELYEHRAQGSLEALRVSLDTVPVEEVDLSDHLAAWLVEKSKAKKGGSSAAKYHTQIRALYPADQPFTLSVFTRREVRRRLELLEVDAPTKNRYKAAVSSFAKYLVLYDVMESNFVRDIEGWGENDARMVYYTRDQAQSLISALHWEQEAPLYAGVAAFAVAFGAEWSAIEALTRVDVDLTPGMERVHLKGTKTLSRRRWVPLVPENRWVLPYIRACVTPGADTALLFAGTSEPVVLRAIQRAATELEIHAVGEDRFGQHTLHDFRHTHAVQLLRDGYSEQIAAAHLGHKNTDMVRTKYGVFIPTREDYARAKLTPTETP